MAGQIGRVFGPQVMEALIRRGENRYAAGPRMVRDRSRRFHPPRTKEDRRSSAAREDRLNRQLELQEARASRGEEFEREKFEHQKAQGKVAIDREARMAKMDQARLEIQRAAQGITQMRDANQLVSTIGRLQAAKNKTDPNTAEVPEGQREGIESLIRVAYGQLVQLLGPERAQQVLGGANPFGTTPPLRAGAGGGAPQPQAPQQMGMGGQNPFSVADEEADEELDDLIPGIPR